MLANDQALGTLVCACVYAYRIRQRQILMCHVHMYIYLYVQLEVCQVMYSEGGGKDIDVDDDDSPMVIGHNIYILAYKLADHKKELKDALEKAEKQGHKAVRHYAKNTAQIEVRTYMYMYACVPLGWESTYTYMYITQSICTYIP